MEKYLLNFFGNKILAYTAMAVLPFFVILPYVLVALWFELKISAHMQDRLGPMRTGGWHGWAQPIADMIKMFQKEDIVPYAVDKKFFLFAPYLVFMGAYAAFAAIPFSSEFIGAQLDVGIFYIIAVSSLVIVGLMMGGLASNNKWSLLGAFRSASQMVSYEIPVALCILVGVMISGTMDLQKINELQQGGIGHWFIMKYPPFVFIAFFIYLIASLAEVNRTPFDIPEADTELVAGYQTEYSGLRWGMFYLAEYTNMFAVSSIASALFLGGWNSPVTWFMSGPSWGVFWFVLKAFTFVLLQMWLRWTLPRVRVDQLMYICWKVLVPFSLVNLLIVGFWIVLN